MISLYTVFFYAQLSAPVEVRFMWECLQQGIGDLCNPTKLLTLSVLEVHFRKCMFLMWSFTSTSYIVFDVVGSHGWLLWMKRMSNDDRWGKGRGGKVRWCLAFMSTSLDNYIGVDTDVDQWKGCLVFTSALASIMMWGRVVLFYIYVVISLFLNFFLSSQQSLVILSGVVI